jgi:hypothetical protein
MNIMLRAACDADFAFRERAYFETMGLRDCSTEAEHIALKKVVGSSDQSVGAARCSGAGGGFRPVLVGKSGDRHRTIHPMAGRAIGVICGVW